MNKKKYSIIVPVYNGAGRIGITIESLLRQTIPSSDFEIVIIDDASNDDTKKVIAQYQNKYSQYDIHYIRLPENRGPATARNKGITSASGSILFFTDDDCEVPAQWIETHLRVYGQHPEIVGVGGWYEPLRNVLISNTYHLFVYLYYRSIFSELLDTFEGTASIFKNRSLFPVFNTANLSIKKWVPWAIGGFNERFRYPGMEDSEFAYRIDRNGYLMYYFPLMVTHHKKLNSWGLLRMATNRIQGQIVYNYLVDLQKNIFYKPLKTPFFFVWEKFIRYVENVSSIRNGKKHLNMRLLIISFIYFFIRHSRISEFYFLRKFKSRAL